LVFWLGWQSHDDLVWLGVVQLLPGFALDGVGVGLKLLDVLTQLSVLLLKLIDLFLQLLIFSALLVPNRQPVFAVNYVTHEQQSQAHYDSCARRAPGAQRKFKRTLAHWNSNRFRRSSFNSYLFFRHPVSTVPYDSTNFSAAAFSASISCSLRASV